MLERRYSDFRDAIFTDYSCCDDHQGDVEWEIREWNEEEAREKLLDLIQIAMFIWLESKGQSE